MANTKKPTDNLIQNLTNEQIGYLLLLFEHSCNQALELSSTRELFAVIKKDEKLNKMIEGFDKLIESDNPPTAKKTVLMIASLVTELQQNEKTKRLFNEVKDELISIIKQNDSEVARELQKILKETPTSTQPSYLNPTSSSDIRKRDTSNIFPGSKKKGGKKTIYNRKKHIRRKSKFSRRKRNNQINIFFGGEVATVAGSTLGGCFIYSFIRCATSPSERKKPSLWIRFFKEKEYERGFVWCVIEKNTKFIGYLGAVAGCVVSIIVGGVVGFFALSVDFKGALGIWKTTISDVPFYVYESIRTGNAIGEALAQVANDVTPIAQTGVNAVTPSGTPSLGDALTVTKTVANVMQPVVIKKRQLTKEEKELLATINKRNKLELERKNATNSANT